MLAKLYGFMSLIADVILCVFVIKLDSVLQFWIPIVLFVGLFAGFIVLHLLFVATVALFVDMKKPCDKPGRFYRFWVDYTMELLLFLSRVRVKVNGAEKIPTDKRFLMVSNHLSNLDPIVYIVAFKTYGMLFVSKPENFKIPVAGQFIHKSGFLPIDRENARNAMKTIHKATDYVKDDVGSVCIYPEGTRSKTGELLEFKDGVFYVCKKAPCPVVVTTVKNTEKIVKNFPFKRTTVVVDVIDVINPEEFTERSTHELSENIRNMMAEKLQ